MIFRGVGPERNLGIFYEWIRFTNSIALKTKEVIA